MISGKLFHFQSFRNFGNLKIDFGVILKIVSDNLSILLELRYFFAKILTHY